MKILLLGGSNAGTREGWAFQFQRQAVGHEVENRFLGAVGSLYGLMALLRMEREGDDVPDAIVFEYCLNDILLFAAGALKPPLVVDALRAIANICARRRIRLMFLCLAPRPSQARAARRRARRIRRLYAEAATRHATPCLWLEDAFPGGPTAAQFQDENHLTPEASARVAAVALEAIEGARIPRAEGEEPPFDYIAATQARLEGACELRRLDSKVFEGLFIHLKRPSASFWPGCGRLVGLMLRSDEASGHYLIRAGSRSFRKNARSRMQDIVRHLMLLHYATRRPWTDEGVEIAMPADEAALMAIAEDATPLAVAPTAAFAAQTLDIHGLMFWRKRSLLARLAAYLRRYSWR
ncbi:hypothetical protein V3H18_10880 [Methylocystis sp. 9N]|uniref:SGNH/GDSL hydrolase family protein n=1 Tax=Methylocystis borbori TaxID=3118750 RepID=A0ABU7XI19_9HYPH